MFRIFNNENKNDQWKIPLPDDITPIVIEYCPPEEQKKLINHPLFSEVLLAQRILYHVALGEQEKAEAILRELKDDKIKLAKLLSQKNNVTDLSGRTFQRITPLQYSLWALDRHMWTMLLIYLPEDKAALQLKELENLGITYVRAKSIDNKPEVLIKKERHFDFSALISALEDYINNFEYYRGNNILADTWRQKVGLAQRYIPVHVANEYCRADRSFAPTPGFNDRTLPRVLKFNYNDWPFNFSDWFSDQVIFEEIPLFGKVYVNAALGQKCAIFRGKEKFAQVISEEPPASRSGFSNLFCVNKADANIDLHAIKSLRNKRIYEYKSLKTMLEDKYFPKLSNPNEEKFFRKKLSPLHSDKQISLELVQINKEIIEIPDLKLHANPTIFLKKVIEIDDKLNKIETIPEDRKAEIGDLKQRISKQMNIILRFIASENEISHTFKSYSLNHVT